MGIEYESYFTVMDMMQKAGNQINSKGNPILYKKQLKKFINDATGLILEETSDFSKASPGDYVILYKSIDGFHVIYGGVTKNKKRFLFDPSVFKAVDLDLENLKEVSIFKCDLPKS